MFRRNLRLIYLLASLNWHFGACDYIRSSLGLYPTGLYCVYELWSVQRMCDTSEQIGTALTEPHPYKPVFLNRRAAARYRDLASIIPGSER
jgi:hypothetical protein